jgi:hypothetical protein
MGLLGDLIDCLEGREEIPYCQVGKGENMSSQVSSHQQGEMTEKDQRCLLIIGGIEVFLPHSPFEAIESVEDEAVGEGQPVVTIGEREELE